MVGSSYEKKQTGVLSYARVVYPDLKHDFY